jgi:hypothetical protein
MEQVEGGGVCTLVGKGLGGGCRLSSVERLYKDGSGMTRRKKMRFWFQQQFKSRSLRSIALLMALLLPLSAMGGSVAAEESTVAAVDSQLNTAFTYQGQLKRTGTPFSGDCAFQFSLWDADTAGAQQGATQSIADVAVANGLFTVQLDFGNQFTGDTRWLEIGVQCAGDAEATTLAPRVLLTASPYAIGLMPGSEATGAIAGSQGIFRTVNTGAGAALVGLATAATGTTYGILGNAFSPNGYAVMGYSDGGATAVHGYADGGGRAIYGVSPSAIAVEGSTTTGTGVVGKSRDWVGVYGESVNQSGVWGKSTSGGGVYGESTSWVGVWGQSTTQSGVTGKSQDLTGVWGESQNYDGIIGISKSTVGKAGVVGVNDEGNGPGVYARSVRGDGMVGFTSDPAKAGVAGINTGTGNGLYGRSDGGGYAAFFEGRAATRVMEVLGGADLAELFTVSGLADPGTLLVIDPANPGQLMPSTQAYDTRIAGIVSGAGGVNPGLTLQQEGVLDGDTQVAIAGRVYVQAEALSAPIQPGDLLTTSDMPGHAMKAADRTLAYGAVIGKAMTGLDEGTGLVLVLVNLQ